MARQSPGVERAARWNSHGSVSAASRSVASRSAQWMTNEHSQRRCSRIWTLNPSPPVSGPFSPRASSRSAGISGGFSIQDRTSRIRPRLRREVTVDSGNCWTYRSSAASRSTGRGAPSSWSCSACMTGERVESPDCSSASASSRRTSSSATSGVHV